MKEVRTLKHIPARWICLLIGLSIMAFGVAFSIKASLGTSPISSFPYVTSWVSGLSTGTTTIIINIFFVVLQILILSGAFGRRQGGHDCSGYRSRTVHKAVQKTCFKI